MQNKLKVKSYQAKVIKSMKGYFMDYTGSGFLNV